VSLAPSPPDEVEAAPEPAKNRSRALIEWGIVVVVAVVVSLLIRAFVFQTFFIPSGSMEPTLHIGDRILVSKLSVEFGTINRGDILVFRAPPAVKTVCGDDVADLVKRVIGLPGDHLTSVGNTIYYTTAPVKKPWNPLKAPWKAVNQSWTHYEPIGRAIGDITVPKNHYFMMGDNEDNSCDSRFWGTVPRSSIIGKAFFRIWPLSRIGFL